MEDYKPNSHKFKASQSEDEQSPPEKKVTKVVRGPVKTKKKSELSKIAGVFISEDIGRVGSYVFSDILVPAIKNAVSDIVTNGIDILLFGEGGRRKKSTNASGVSYRSFYDSRDSRRERDEPRTRTGYAPDDIVLNSRGEAEEVLSRMEELIETYGTVSVADLYDLVGKTGNWTDNRYGWTNIRSAEAVRVWDGYVLKLPKALPIKRQ